MARTIRVLVPIETGRAARIFRSPYDSCHRSPGGFRWGCERKRSRPHGRRSSTPRCCSSARRASARRGSRTSPTASGSAKRRSSTTSRPRSRCSRPSLTAWSSARSSCSSGRPATAPVPCQIGSTTSPVRSQRSSTATRQFVTLLAGNTRYFLGCPHRAVRASTRAAHSPLRRGPGPRGGAQRRQRSPPRRAVPVGNVRGDPELGPDEREGPAASRTAAARGDRAHRRMRGEALAVPLDRQCEEASERPAADGDLSVVDRGASPSADRTPSAGRRQRPLLAPPRHRRRSEDPSRTRPPSRTCG